MSEFALYPSLKNKTVVISGGAQGIGAEMVKAFAAQGARVGFLDLDETASAALAADLENVSYEICDLRDIDAMRSALARLTERLGTAHVLVTMPRAMIAMIGRTLHLCIGTSGKAPICVTCSLRSKRLLRA